MNPTTGVASALASLETGAEALASAAAWLETAGAQIEPAEGQAGEVRLLAEEARDVLTRVKAERVKLGCA